MARAFTGFSYDGALYRCSHAARTSSCTGLAGSGQRGHRAGLRHTGAYGAVAPGQDHSCIVGKAPPAIDWSALANPVLSYPKVGVKDQALQWSGGAWHMLFSDMTQTSAAPHVKFDVAIAQSPDLRHWSAPTVIATDAASPDIVRDPAGEFVVTYQTPTGLDYRVSPDSSLQKWSSPHTLGHGLAHRMIDAALAFTGHGVILGFKAGTTQATLRNRLGTVADRHLPSCGSARHRDLWRHRGELRVPDGRWGLEHGGHFQHFGPAVPLHAGSGGSGQPEDLAAVVGRPRADDPKSELQHGPRHLERRLRTCQLGLPLCRAGR